MDDTFERLIDLREVRELLESHHQLSGMSNTLLDAHEENLIAVGWEDICTKFHRVHPVTCARCRESDAFIKTHLRDIPDQILEYRCENHMIDIAMPIVIDGKHRATYFTGQFFYDDDPPDEETFLVQAREFGFDPQAYLAALAKVPRFSREHVRSNVIFLRNMVRMLAEMGLKNLRLAGEIEERRRAETALRNQYATLRGIIDSVSARVFSVDRQYRYTSFSESHAASMAALYGADISPGQSLLEAMTVPADRETARRNLDRALAGEHLVEESYSGDELLSRRYIQVSHSPIRGGDGAVIGVAVLVQDMTDRKRAEEEVKALNKHLEQRVAERTAELSEANRELESFAYSVSHDLRAPLRHVAGYLELLERSAGEGLSREARHYLESSTGATQRMATLIEDLLSFSRMARVALSKGPVNLAALAREVVEELELEASGRVVRWRIGELPVVTGDPAMLRVVMMNLLSNALKFTRTRPEAEIEVLSGRGSPGEKVVSVRDNGVGFDQAYAGHLFEAFQRLHRTEEFDGVGIGLANVRRIVSRHGGRVWAEGKVDSGATFTFTLPDAPAA